MIEKRSNRQIDLDPQMILKNNSNRQPRQGCNIRQPLKTAAVVNSYMRLQQQEKQLESQQRRCRHIKLIDKSFSIERQKVGTNQVRVWSRIRGWRGQAMQARLMDVGSQCDKSKQLNWYLIFEIKDYKFVELTIWILQILVLWFGSC